MANGQRRRYKLLITPHIGFVGDGETIGYQDFPNQFVDMPNTQIQKICADKRTADLSYGIWIYDLQKAFYLPILQTHRYRNGPDPDYVVSDEGIRLFDTYVDLCTPFDRYGNEVDVNDTVAFAVTNHVHRGIVTKISKNIFGYNISYDRKLTVRDTVEDRAYTINDPYRVVKL